MTMNPLPPQAYTKDTLTKAYTWLLHQNASIRELATTPDILVSLFLKAQRNGDEALETPSIQNFKNELKSLAGMMGELEGKKLPQTSTAPVAAQVPSPAPTPAPTPAPKQIFAQQAAPQPTPVPTTPDVVSQLDAKTKAMIAEVREQLNLGSDVEVMRLLISLGYHKAKGLYS